MKAQANTHPPLVEAYGDASTGTVHLKLEGHQPTGSIKDRLTTHLLLQAREAGLAPPHSTVVEISRGNTALSLARAARILDLRCETVVPSSVSPALLQRVTEQGALAIQMAAHHTPQDALDILRDRVRKGALWLNQFSNPHAATAYRGLACALVREIPRMDCVVVAIGTGNTMAGLRAGLTELLPRPPYLLGVRTARATAGPDEAYRFLLEHMCTLFPSREVAADEVIQVAAHDSEAGQRWLSLQGISGGRTSGAVYHTALQLSREGRFRRVVGICADGRLVATPADTKGST